MRLVLEAVPKTSTSPPRRHKSLRVSQDYKPGLALAKTKVCSKSIPSRYCVSLLFPPNMSDPPKRRPPLAPPLTPSLSTSPLCPFSSSFSPTAALEAPLSALSSALPTRRDRHFFQKSLPLNNLFSCSTLSTAPFRPLVNAPRSAAAAPATARRRVVHDSTPVQEWDVLGDMHAKLASKGGVWETLGGAVRRRGFVRVVMRTSGRKRGVVDGLLVAFDRHMNVVLGNASVRDDGEERKRVRQLFIRGDNVVAICLG